MRSSLTIWAALVCVALGLPARATADLYHAATDFSATDNPNGVWSYGWTPTLGGKFTLYSETVDYKGVLFWSVPDRLYHVGYNPTDRVIQYRDIFWQPGDMTFHPGPSGEHSVVRWSAPADGYVAIYVTFQNWDRSGNGDTTVHVLGNGKSLFDGRVYGYDQPESFQEFYTEDYLWVNAGDTIDFAVGPNGRYDYDTTKLDAWVAFEPAR